jgi:hypothetical protein
MSILIGKYEFDGPFNSVADLEEKPGIFAVLHCDGEDYELIHVAEADNVKERLEISQSTYTSYVGSVLIAACYAPLSRSRERRVMVEDILREFDDEDGRHCDNEPLITAAFQRL